MFINTQISKELILDNLNIGAISCTARSPFFAFYNVPPPFKKKHKYDHRESSLFTTFMNKEDSSKCHQFVIRYGYLVMTEPFFTIRKIKTQKLLLAKVFY